MANLYLYRSELGAFISPLDLQNNLNYAICIRRAADFCDIVYANEIGRIEYQFQLLNVDQGMIKLSWLC